MTVGSTSTGLQMTLNFDSSIEALKTQKYNATTSYYDLVTGAFATAAKVFTDAIGTRVNVGINVSWGKIYAPGATYSLPTNSIAATLNYRYGALSRSTTLGMISKPSNTAAAALSTLKSSSQSSTSYYVTAANAKAIGLVPSSGSMDGYIGFGLAPSSFSYSTGPATSGTYNFISVAEHEISEVLGRVSGFNYGLPTGSLMLYDMFRFTGAGVDTKTASAKAYFSVDGGKTVGRYFNTSGSGDYGDWAQVSGKPDPFDYAGTKGASAALDAIDLATLYAIGWTPGSPTSQAGVSAGGLARSATCECVLEVPEPAGLGLFGLALSGLLVGGVLRRSGSPATA